MILSLAVSIRILPGGVARSGGLAGEGVDRKGDKEIKDRLPAGRVGAILQVGEIFWEGVVSLGTKARLNGLPQRVGEGAR